MNQGRTTDGRSVEIIKRSSTAVLVRMLEDDQLQYLPHAAIARVDTEVDADAPPAPLHVRVARTVAAEGFMTPKTLIESTGRCESDIAPVMDHLVRTGVLERRRVGGVVGYVPADDPT